MSSRSPLVAVALSLAFVAAPASAKLTKKSIAKIWPSSVGFALDESGAAHVAYASPGFLPFHALQVGKKFSSTLVDDRPDAGWHAALGLGPGGTVHVAYHAERMAPSYLQTLVYATSSDGSTWSREDVAEGGYATSLAVDADDRAHLLAVDGGGLLFYAVRNDVGFDVEPLGFPADAFRSTSLALDPGGHAHACWVHNTGVGVDALYGTNASGAWETTLLDPQGHLCSLALASDGTPVVATLGPGALRLFRGSGAGFEEEAIADFADLLPGFAVGPDGLALTLGAEGQALLLATIFASQGGGGGEAQLFFAHDGEEWRAALLGTKEEGFDPKLATLPSGAVAGVWRSSGEGAAKLSFLTATFPDLAGSWEAGVAASGAGVTGTLTVANQGTEKAKGVPIALYLSDDAVLGDDDIRLADAKVGAVAAGAVRTVAVEVATPIPPSGKLLIAVVDPAKALDDLDRLDNTVATVIP